MKPEDKIFRFLDTDGDGTGTKNAIVDGSSTPVVFKIVNARPMLIHRALFHVGGTGALATNKFGTIAALANGLEFGVYKVSDDSLVLDLFDGLTIQQNTDFRRLCYDAAEDRYGTGNATEYMTARWSFNRSGDPLEISSANYLAMVVNDNLSATLLDVFCQVQGEYRGG